MSSTNHTQHYGLSQWEPEDAFLREDFNEDFRKIDAAIADIPRPAFGRYVGEFEESNRTERTIELGFSPKMVVLMPTDGSIADPSGRRYGGLFAQGHPLYVQNPDTGWAAKITDTGFVVRNMGANLSANNKDKTYYYLAIG